MNIEVTKSRDQIEDKYKWNIESMYNSDDRWNRDIEDARTMSEQLRSQEGHVLDSSSSLLETLKAETSISRKLSNAIVYSHMKQDEDNSNSKYLEMNQRAMTAAAEISAALSFIVPEILEGDPSLIEQYINKEPGLEEYRFMLDNILQQKSHVLSKDEEKVLSSLGDVLGAPGEIFTMLNNADMNFGSVEDSEGKSHLLTHGTYSSLMEDPDRTLRKNAFTRIYSKYMELINSIATMYNYSVKENTVSSRLRNYDSPLDAALSPDHIPLQVYDNLIEVVHKHLPEMHKYTAIKKKALGLEEMEMFDVYIPPVKPVEKEYSFEEAVDIACEALAPLGSEYVSTLKKGLLEERWVDVYENKGKTSGAYSFGSYDSYPFILMNFTGRLNDIFTLVHEGGHSMHSYYTRRNQPYIYGGHSIFTAEVASTVNESLLIRYLLKKAEKENDLEMKKYLVNYYADQFKSTLFRQTMFGEFEKKTHEIVSQGGSLTADLCSEIYDKLNTDYFGPAMKHSDLIKYEWSRIPHFYRDFYVYQYATGFSAATALSERILTGGTEARNDYLRFLSLGDSDYPVSLLKIAGVDMSSPEPVDQALNVFGDLVDQLDKLL